MSLKKLAACVISGALLLGFAGCKADQDGMHDDAQNNGKRNGQMHSDRNNSRYDGMHKKGNDAMQDHSSTYQ